MLSLHKLEIFVAVVQEGSFSAAAGRFYMTQPAVSQHIQDLEGGLGTQLFKRGRRGVTLTPAGETLYNYTQRILKLVAEAEAAVTNVEKLNSGQLSIGATPGVSVYLLPEWVRGFRERYPKLAVSLHTDVTTGIASDVLGRRLDVGFVEGEIDEIKRRGLGWLVLSNIQLYVVVGEGHDWCQRDEVDIHMLDNHPFITRQPGSRTRIWIDSMLAQHAIKPRIVGEFDNPESIKQAVLSNMGVTILPEYAIAREQTQRLLRGLPVRNVPLQRSLKLLWDVDAPFTPITRAFLRQLSIQYPNLTEVL